MVEGRQHNAEAAPVCVSAWDKDDGACGRSGGLFEDDALSTDEGASFKDAVREGVE